MNGVDRVDDVGDPGSDALRGEVGVHVELCELDRQFRKSSPDGALGAAQEGRDDLGEDVPLDARQRGVAGQPLAEGQRRGARAAADLDERRPARRRQRADDRLGAEPVVDLVEQVVVGEVVEPQRQPRGREQDLLARLLAAQERGHVLDHRPHDREGRHRPRIDGARLRLGAVRVARRQRAARAVDRIAAGRRNRRYLRPRELAQEPPDRDLGARREPAVRHDPARGRASDERSVEAELVNQAQDGVDREPVEVLGAEDELGREERADRRVGNAREQRVEVLGARRHAADSRPACRPAPRLNEALRMKFFA